MLFLPLLEPSIELEEFGECGANDFAFRGLLAAYRLNVAYVVSEFIQLPSVHITLNRLESLDVDDRDRCFLRDYLYVCS